MLPLKTYINIMVLVLAWFWLVWAPYGVLSFFLHSKTTNISMHLDKPRMNPETRWELHPFSKARTLLADSVWKRASLCPVLNLSLNLLTALLTACCTDGSSQKIRTPSWTSNAGDKKNNRGTYVSAPQNEPRLHYWPAVCIWIWGGWNILCWPLVSTYNLK